VLRIEFGDGCGKARACEVDDFDARSNKVWVVHAAAKFEREIPPRGLWSFERWCGHDDEGRMIEMRSDQKWSRGARAIFAENEKIARIIAADVEFGSARTDPPINPSHDTLFVACRGWQAGEFEKLNLVAAFGDVCLSCL